MIRQALTEFSRLKKKIIRFCVQIIRKKSKRLSGAMIEYLYSFFSASFVQGMLRS